MPAETGQAYGFRDELCAPREFELEGTEAIIRKDGRRLIIEPVPPRNGLLCLLADWAPLDEAFPAIADPPPTPVDVF